MGALTVCVTAPAAAAGCTVITCIGCAEAVEAAAAAGVSWLVAATRLDTSDRAAKYFIMNKCVVL